MLAVLRKELHDAVRGRWLIAFAASFAVLALFLSVLQRGGEEVGAEGFTRTTAGLLNLCLLLIPLLALVLGAGSIAGERDRGTLVTLLSQPISHSELLLGKYAGLLVAVWLAVLGGFGVAGLLAALLSPLADVEHYLLFVGLSGVLASAMLSVGLLVSVLSDGRVKAMTAAILIWFVFVLFYDLGAIGLALHVTSSGQSLLVAALGNPVESIRILAILSLEPDPTVLGPLGSYLSQELGKFWSVALLCAGIMAWTLAPLAAAILVFRRQDA
ncbi:MAG: ABC transporter permease subunit [Dehalococcoidia bacterium]